MPSLQGDKQAGEAVTAPSSRPDTAKRRGEGCGRRIGRINPGPCGEVGLCGECWQKAEDRDRTQTDVGPHAFRPLGRIFYRNRCVVCYVPQSEHPVGGWVTARPIGDRRAKP